MIKAIVNINKLLETIGTVFLETHGYDQYGRKILGHPIHKRKKTNRSTYDLPPWEETNG